MRLDITYVNHRGQALKLARGEELGYSSTDIHEGDFSFKDANGAIASTSRSSRDIKITVEVRAEPNNKGELTRDRLIDVLETDTAHNVDGSLYVNGWHIACRLKSVSEKKWWFDAGRESVDIVLHSASAIWLKEETLTFGLEQLSGGRSLNYKKFPHGYKYAYKRFVDQASITNAGAAPASAIIRFYGRCTNPYIIIGENRYEVMTTAADGERLEIDGVEKTANLIGMDGRSTSVFSKLTTGLVGGGAYPFEKIPVGKHGVSWPGTFQCDVVLLHERSVPAWA